PRPARTARTTGTRPPRARRARPAQPRASHRALHERPRGHELRTDRGRAGRAGWNGPFAAAQRARRPGRRAGYPCERITTMNCADAVVRLSAALDGDLAADDAGDVRRHLDTCEACARRYRTLQQVRT